MPLATVVQTCARQSLGAAVSERRVEDRRIGCQPGDAVLVDVALQRAVVEDLAGDVVQPEALADVAQGLQVGHVDSLSVVRIPWVRRAPTGGRPVVRMVAGRRWPVRRCRRWTGPAPGRMPARRPRQRSEMGKATGRGG